MKQIRNENSHGLGTQRDSCKKIRLFPTIFELSNPVIQEQFRPKKVYLYRSTRPKPYGMIVLVLFPVL